MIGYGGNLTWIREGADNWTEWQEHVKWVCRKGTLIVSCIYLYIDA